MYYYLSGALKRRLIAELKDSYSQHPLYEKIVPYIQNKYAFEERPQFGIVVKGGSANKVALSADNFLGTISSHVMLAYFEKEANPIEWVREDDQAIRENGGMFPIQAGIYYLEILSVPETVSDPGQYVIDPLLTVMHESVRVFPTGIEHEAQLNHIPVKGTVRLYENAYYGLKENTDYTIDYATGKVTFLATFAPNTTVLADYRYAADSLGPIDFYWNRPDFTTLPGVVMAFGKRARVGDKMAVVVTADRVDTAHAFGGKFEYTFDLDVIATDPNQTEEIADLGVMYLWANKRNELASEGIEIVEVSVGGEAEEQRDEQAQEFYYTASLSVQMRADWEVLVPLPFTISKATSTLHQASSRLFFSTVPIFSGRNNDYERIG